MRKRPPPEGPGAEEGGLVLVGSQTGALNLAGGGTCLLRSAERGQELPLTKPPPLLQLALPLGGRRYAGPGRPGERRLILSGQRSGWRSCLWPAGIPGGEAALGDA